MAQANTTGVRAATFQNLQLNAGILLKDFDYSTATDSATLKTLIATAKTAGTALLGATRGGGSFAITPAVRQVEADGVRSAFKGQEICDGYEVKLTTTLIEMTAGNLQLALPGLTKDTTNSTTTKNIYTLAEYFSDADYVSHLIWIGDTSTGYVLIDLENGLNTSGLTLAFTDKGEGTIPLEITAHCGSLDSDTAPVKVIFFTPTSA